MPEEPSPTPNQPTTLKPCPCCGEPIRLHLCDRVGNFRQPEYEEDPRSGLGFLLIHEVKDGECPIGTHDGESLGSFIYDTREEAATAWNRRTPEPIVALPETIWHEDHGPALWWRFPIDEPPYAGTPLDGDWPGYHTHWTPIHCPVPPEPLNATP